MQILRQEDQFWEARITPDDRRWLWRAVASGVLFGILLSWFVWQYLVQQVALLSMIHDPLFWVPGSLLTLLVSASLTYETQTVALNRVDNQFRIRQRNIFQQKTLQGRLDRIRNVQTVRLPDTDGPDRFKVTLQIVDQRDVALTSGYSLHAAQVEQFDSLRQFLGLAIDPPAIVSQAGLSESTGETIEPPMPVYPVIYHNQQTHTSLKILRQTASEFQFKLHYAFWSWLIVVVSGIMALFMMVSLLPLGFPLTLLASLPMLVGGALLYIVGFAEVWTFDRATGMCSIQPQSFLPIQAKTFPQHVVTAIQLATEYPDVHQRDAQACYNVHVLTVKGVKLRQGKTVGRVIYGFQRRDEAEQFMQALHYYVGL